jgi:ferric-dicitrate binding protein FerR (iron transport regulator)
MSEESSEDRALDRVSAELRDMPAPELDWERMEARLSSRIDAEERRERRASSLRVVAALAVAAGLLLLLGGLWRSQPATVVRAPETSAGAERVFGLDGATIDGATLAVGDRVEARERAGRVEHAGHATWTLDPNSQATIAAVGAVIRVQLTAGALGAQVVPREQPETFVVAVDGARVAVHGTAFRVVRTDAALRVSVTEGVVAVGAAGEPAGWLLRAGDSGSFARGREEAHQRGAAAGRCSARGGAGEGAGPDLVRDDQLLCRAEHAG